ncbi:MAG: riboflavin biosynthesis protein RibF [Clostridia bacterium]|nr:riboflavin biosynthesis protein RibF [Clostridia bacterium]
MAVKRYTWRERDALPTTHRAVALGVFDGLHIGHRAVLAAACGVIDEDGAILTATALCMTGVPKHKSGRLLTAWREAQLLDTLGTDEWIEMPFEEVHELSPERFVREILCDLLHARVVCCGYNYQFGKHGVGTVDTLRTLCEPLGIRVIVVNAVERDGKIISSTRVREAVAAGDMVTAAQLLGRPFSVELPVTDGDHRGRQWGVPTLNQVFPADYAVPRYGVYASLVVVGEHQYHAVTNIGVHPTVGGVKEPQAETWIREFEGELYGKTVHVMLVRFLREERCFAGVEELKKQIAIDAETAQAVLAGQSGEKAVIFDFDDTLQDRTAAFLAVARQLLSRHMHAADAEKLEQYARQMCAENRGGYVDYSTFFHEFIKRWSFKEGVTGEQLLWEYHRLFPLHSALYPETIAVLREIRQRGYRIGIITNGNPLLQNRKLDLTGLRLCTDLVMISGDEGIHKPHPELFRRAAARLGVAPENCVYVGDHPINDIKGAKSAGMQAIYLNTRDLDEHPNDVPEVRRLADILNIL